MPSRAPIRRKLFLLILAVTIPAVTIVGVVSFVRGRAVARDATLDHLTSVRASRADQLETAFQQLRVETDAISRSRMIVRAMRGFGTAFNALGASAPTDEQRDTVVRFYNDHYLPTLAAQSGEVASLEELFPSRFEAIHLQSVYLADNPYPRQDRDLLVDADDPSAYGEVHRELHPDLREFTSQFTYHDLLLIDLEGNVVYTVNKEPVLATSLVQGPYRNSNLATAYREAVEAPMNHRVRFVDFAFYRPSLSAPMAFVAAPVFDGDQRTGVVAFQLTGAEMDGVMTGRGRWRDHGLGETGEAYIVGSDHLLRSNSRFFLENVSAFVDGDKAAEISQETRSRMAMSGTSVLLLEVSTPQVAAALAGETGTMIATDYRGEEVLASYEPLKIEGLDWVVVAEMDTAEAFVPVRQFVRRMAGASAVLALFILGISWFAARRFVKPIVDLDDASRRFAQGDEDIRLTIGSEDELGRLTASFNEMIAAIRQQKDELRRNYDEIKRQREELAVAKEATEAANRKMRGDLEAAARIQATLLPEESVEMEGARFAWRYVPCDELAGDTLGIVPFDESRVGVYVVDVSGHGVPSSLLSVSVSRLLSKDPASSVLWVTDRASEERRIATPAEVLRVLSRRFPYDTRTNQYFTMVYGVLDLNRRELCYASAGHEPLIVVGPNREPEMGSSTGPPVALIPEIIKPSVYEERSISLTRGDRIYLYSDGIPEAAAADGEQFGGQRLSERLRELFGNDLDDGLPTLLDAVRAWQEGPSFADDVSVLAVELVE
ncbi:MAG: SpoIIE family protein phosphatase [Acidobacteriota bacterium]|jgi:serine phosphatase RsbU (regulator of sigma subunit)